jgi:hypothetical protein
MGSVLRHDVKYRPSYHDDSDDGNDDVDTTVLLQVNPTLLYSFLHYSTLLYSTILYSIVPCLSMRSISAPLATRQRNMPIDNQ